MPNDFPAGIPFCLEFFGEVCATYSGHREGHVTWGNGGRVGVIVVLWGVLPNRGAVPLLSRGFSAVRHSFARGPIPFLGSRRDFLLILFWEELHVKSSMVAIRVKRSRTLFPVHGVISPKFYFVVGENSFVKGYPKGQVCIRANNGFFRGYLVRGGVTYFRRTMGNSSEQNTLVRSDSVKTYRTFPTSLCIASTSLLRRRVRVPLRCKEVGKGARFFVDYQFFHHRLTHSGSRLALVVKVSLPIHSVEHVFGRCPSTIKVANRRRAARSRATSAWGSACPFIRGERLLECGGGGWVRGAFLCYVSGSAIFLVQRGTCFGRGFVPRAFSFVPVVICSVTPLPLFTR